MKLKRLIAGVVSAAMMLSIGSTLAFADAASEEVTYANGAMTFESVMYLSDDAVSAPNVTYTYTLASVTGYSFTFDTTSSNFITGVTTNVTSSSDTETTADATPLSVDVAFTTSDYAVGAQVIKEVTFDFSSVAYTEPGVYVYSIEEVSDSTDDATEGLINESNDTRYVYVTVKNSGAAADATSYEVSGIVMTEERIETVSDSDTTDDVITLAVEQTKSAGYIHSYGIEGTDPADENDPIEPGTDGSKSQNFVIDLTVKGDMANNQKYFNFTVAMTAGVDANTIFKVKDATDATAYVIYLDGSNTSYTQSAGLYFVNVTTDTNDDVTAITSIGDAFTFEMMSGQSYTIYAVVKDMSFTTTIDDDTKDDGYAFYSRAYEAEVGSEWTLSATHKGTADDTYSSTVADDEGSSFAAVRGADDTVDEYGDDLDDEIDDDNKIEYDAAFPETGVVLDLLPYVAMVAIAGAFIAFRVVKSAHKDEE